MVLCPPEPLPTPDLPLAGKAPCRWLCLVQAAGKHSLALPLLELQGKNAANKAPLSQPPACHIQAISLLLSHLYLFFFPPSARQEPREAEAVEGWHCPTPGNSEAEETLPGPCGWF